MPSISKDQLQYCDVLLYHGTAFISRLIRLFDGGHFSHASIYMGGGKVLEAIGTGITSRDLSTSLEGAAYVDVFRFVSDSGQKLGAGGLPEDPILARVRLYKEKADRYAYEQILLLAALAATRRLPVIGWIPGLGSVLRTIFDSAAELLSRLIAMGREPMICSELVFRCFEEAGPAYKIKIRGADILAAASLSGTQPIVQPLTAMADSQTAREQQDLQLAAAEFLAKYAVARNVNAPAGVATPLAVPDFITPRDLETSPNLYHLGTLKL